MTVIVKDKETKMDKGLIMWAVFAAVFAAGVLINRVIKKGAENGIETGPRRISISMYMFVIARRTARKSKQSSRIPDPVSKRDSPSVSGTIRR